ncbi:MAG TPA: Na+/H+ antiporter NhaC [Anaerolineales bacterium]|nr:Na+/H+ antiporter NhaC [Anaerolineales bacterium]
MDANTVEKERAVREPSLVDALIPLLFMILLLALSIVLFGLDAALGPLQVALFMSAVVAAVVAHKNGHSWERLGEEIVKGISLAMSAIMILLMVGSLIGVWNMSGTIATVIYYGIKYIDPAWFYLAAALLTGIIGLVTGSSWTTAATVGVAFIGMSQAIHASAAITAGAVISGAYFGDKMTPLSETTILTPQIVGSDVYTHIRSMAKATIPAYLISLVIFFLIGRYAEISAPPVGTAAALQALGSVYNITLWTLIPIVALLLLGLRKYPAFLSILIGTLVGALVAVFTQPQLITAFANDPSLSYPLAAIKSIWSCMANGFSLSTGFPDIDKLFTGGGMSSMLSTVWLILGAMSFGAMMDFGGFNARLINPIINRVKSAGGSIATVMLTALGLNIIGGDQYIAIVLPARMFMIPFRERGIHPETLATAVENSGTVTSPLIPWNSCGAYMSAALGVSTFVYLPYCFFNFLNFLLGLVYGFLNINVMRLEPGQQPPLDGLRPAPLVDLNK